MEYESLRELERLRVCFVILVKWGMGGYIGVQIGGGVLFLTVG